LPPFILADVVLGAAALAASVWLRHHAREHGLARADDEVVRNDLTSGLRWWGLAVLLLGLLALGQFPGGFTLPIWSVLGLGLGALGVGVTVVRWRVEGWNLQPGTTSSETWVAESETWQFALIGWVSALAATYVLGVLLNIMQPVHLGISLLESAVGYALGLVIWTPQTKLHRTAISAPPESDAQAAMVLRSRGLRSRRARRAAAAREISRRD
jgi:hypothetical protein